MITVRLLRLLIYCRSRSRRTARKSPTPPRRKRR